MKAIKNSALGLFGITGVLVSIFGIKIPFAESFAKEHWRAGLAALLLIILMIPAAIGLFLYLVDTNRFKTEIVQYVKAHSQRDLLLQGDLKLTFFPKLGLDSGKMSLSERNSAREFASINNARLYIAWWPLFKKQLVLERVEIDGIRANLTRFKDGTTNFDDLLIRNEVLSPVTFDIEGLRVTNSAINWQDDMKWQRVAVQDLNIETGRLADTVPGNLKASFHVNSERLRSDANIELKSSLFFDRKSGRYEFADIGGTLAGTAGGFSNLDLNFKGSLDSHPAQQSLLAENLLVSGNGNYGQRSFEARLAVPRLQYTNGLLNGSDAALDATLSQFDEKWKLTAHMPALEFANKMFKAADFSADFAFNGQGAELRGKLSGPVSLDLDTTPKLLLSAISVDLSAKHPMLSGELSATATGSLNADLSARNANLGFTAKIDDSDISGTLAVADFSHPAYTVALNIDRIDLDRYIAADWIKRYQNDAARVDLGGLKDLNLSGSVHAGEIRVAKLKANKLAAGIKIEQSVLTIAPVSARLYGGTLSGSFSASAQGKPQITLMGNLAGIQVNSLLADTAAIGKLNGRGDVALNISTEGGSIGELRKALNGNLSLALGRGSIAGIDLRAALVDGKDDLGSKSAPRVHQARFSERTDFSALKAVFNVRDGISHGNSFELRYPLYRVSGEGDIVPGSGTVDYQLEAIVSSALKRRSAGDLAELRGVTVPVRVSGSWAAPAIALDFAGASGDIVTKRIAAKAETEQAAAEQAALTRPAAAHKKPAGKAKK
jgi:AsmA protein